MSATPLSAPRLFWRDPDTDLPLVGGKVYFYAAGTTTPKDVYGDAAKSSTLTNPVILQADGGFDVYIDGAYKLAVYRPDDTLIDEVDNILGGSGIVDGLTGERVVYTSNHQIDLDDSGKILVADRPTAITFSIVDAATLGSGFMVIIQNDGAGDLTLDPSLSELIDGGATKVVKSGESLVLTGTGFSFFTELYVQQTLLLKPQTLTDAQILQVLTNLGIAGITQWTSKAIGEIYYADTSITGVEIPPTDNPAFRYILLTAGEDGVGEYNEGVLISESVSGSAPLVLATAVIDYAASPMDGQTIHHYNTERRMERPSPAPGALQNDAFQGSNMRISGVNVAGSGGRFNQTGDATSPNTGSPITNIAFDHISDGVNGTPRVATETRVKNVGVSAYRRIA